MDFGRILANAVARRVAYVLVAAALAWLGLGEARASSCPDASPSSNRVCDQGQAYSQCFALASSSASQSSDPRGRVPYCTLTGTNYNAAHCANNGSGGCVSGTAASPLDNRFFFRPASLCSTRSSITSEFNPKSGSTSCNSGCSFTWYRNSDGTSTAYPNGSVCTNAKMPESCVPGEEFWNPILNVCEPMTPECPAGQALNSRGICGPEECPAGMKLQADNTCGPAKEECPAGNIKAPSGECLPGEGQCAAGEARRENGTCGKDSDGDGIADVDDDDPDNDGKESASGGDTCDAPPACNGGAIDCMQVKIQWRIDCNTRRNRNISGGACNAMPVCAGEKCDAMEYAQLLQQWRATCHLEKLANSGLPGGGPGSGSNAMDPVSSDGVLGDDLDPSTVQRGVGGSWNGEGEELAFDESGYGFARTCPTPPTLDVLGKSITFDTSVFCDWMRLGGVFVMIMAYLAGLSIVVRS